MSNTDTSTRKEFRQPDSIVDGVTPGDILENAEPKGVPMRDMWQLPQLSVSWAMT